MMTRKHYRQLAECCQLLKAGEEKSRFMEKLTAFLKQDNLKFNIDKFKEVSNDNETD